jgi:hypothetical protein
MAARNVGGRVTAPALACLLTPACAPTLICSGPGSPCSGATLPEGGVIRYSNGGGAGSLDAGRGHHKAPLLRLGRDGP